MTRILSHVLAVLTVTLLVGCAKLTNPDFERVMAKHFPKDAKVVVGCKSGGRSYRAADFLQSQGWTSVVDMQGGWDGERDGMGRVVVTGWRDSGLPAEKAAQAGRSYEDLTG